MKIGIDARFYGSWGKGLGRYTQMLIKYLEKIDQKNEYYIFLKKDNWNDYQPASKNFKKVLANYRWYSLTEQLLMPLKIWRLGIDVMHFTHFNVPILYFGKFVVTIHDLILTKYPTERATTLGPILYKIKHLGYKFIINSAVRRAAKIIAVSKYTKKEVIENFKVDADKIKVTYEGVDSLAIDQQKSEDVLNKYNITKPYLLYVGNVYPHKNIERLLTSFRSIVKNHHDLKLVLVGKEDYFFKRIKQVVKKMDLDSSVIFAGFVSDNDLPHIYQGSELYVFPSLCEGFGLPALEACYYGVPVVASNNSSLPEILAEAGIYFDPENSDDITEKIELVYNSIELKNNLKEKGYLRVKHFSWEKMSQITLHLYLGI